MSVLFFYVLFILVAIPLIFICIPLRFTLAAESEDFEIAGLVRLEFFESNLIAELDSESIFKLSFRGKTLIEKEVDLSDRKQKREEGQDFKFDLDSIKIVNRHLSVVWDSVSFIFDAMNIRLYLHGSIGADYPDKTALIEPLAQLATRQGEKVDVVITTNYLEPGLDMEGIVRGHFIPAQLFWESLQYFLSHKVQALIFDLQNTEQQTA